MKLELVASNPAEPSADDATRDGASPGFVVDLGAFEGPIDLLLQLARDQKVDLAKISILELAEQYLAYINQARDLQLEIAADYLVTAAWLAYLKSRLLLPQAPEDDEPSGAELAESLAARLRHLNEIRNAASELLERPRLGAARFVRGAPEGIRIRRASRFRLRLHELLQAYVDQRRRGKPVQLVMTPPQVFRIEDALKRVTGMLGGDWRNLLSFLPSGVVDDQLRRSAIAAHVGAALELARDGAIDLNQTSPFGPIYVRRRK